MYMEAPEWFQNAACRFMDPALFLPIAGQSSAEARSVCALCSVRAECLDYALAIPSSSDYGIYAGTTARERRRLRKQRSAA